MMGCCYDAGFFATNVCLQSLCSLLCLSKMIADCLWKRSLFCGVTLYAWLQQREFSVLQENGLTCTDPSTYFLTHTQQHLSPLLSLSQIKASIRHDGSVGNYVSSCPLLIHIMSLMALGIFTPSPHPHLVLERISPYWASGHSKALDQYAWREQSNARTLMFVYRPDRLLDKVKRTLRAATATISMFI